MYWHVALNVNFVQILCDFHEYISIAHAAFVLLNHDSEGLC